MASGKGGSPKKDSVAPVSGDEFDSFKGTDELFVSKKLLDQVVGQEKPVEIIRKAAAQKRNVLLVGIPGTGKSMLAQAMAEILPVSALKDVLIYPNDADPNNPKVQLVPANEGRKIVEKARLEAKAQEDNLRLISLIFPMGWLILGFVVWRLGWVSDIIYAATMIVGFLLFIALALGSQIRAKGGVVVPKLLVDNAGKKIAPFAEATGARAGALLGDVRHDPLQSFVNDNKLILVSGDNAKNVSFEELWGKISSKYPKLIEKHEGKYEAIVFPNEEQVFTYGLKDGAVILSRIFSMNRRPYDGQIVTIKTDKKTLSVTPEHKVATKNKSKEAGKLTIADTLIKLEEMQKETVLASSV